MAFARKMNPCHFEILVANFLREEEEERVKKAMKRLALYRINRVINRNNCLCVLRDYILVAKFRRKHAVRKICKFLSDYILVAKFRRKHAVRKICKFLKCLKTLKIRVFIKAFSSSSTSAKFKKVS